MKKSGLLLFSLLLFTALYTNIQGQDIRTLNTKVADILAQMPARSNEQTESLSSQLISLADSGIIKVLQKLKPYGQSEDIASRFAITSMARYASQKGHEQEWRRLQTNYISAILSSSDKDIQDFLVHQLNYGANEQVVEPLQKYLEDERLCEPVTQLFLCLHSLIAERAFADALGKSSGARQITLVKALGELKSGSSLNQIAALEGQGSISLQRSVLAAIATIGDPSSYTIIWNAAVKVSFKYDPTEATASLIKYTDQLGQNKKELCSKSCLALIEACSKNGLLPVEAAAISIYSRYFPKESLPLLIKFSDSPDSSFRMAVLNIAARSGDPSCTKLWVKQAKKSSPEITADIAYMLGERNDKTAVSFLKNCLKSKSQKIRIAAIWALVKIDSRTAIPYLVNHIAKGNDVFETGKAIKTLVKETDLDIINNAIDKSTIAGKAGLIEILGAKAGKRFFSKLVFYSSEKDTIIRSAAIAALVSTSSSADLKVLFELLSKNDNPHYIVQIQKSIVNAIKEEKDQDKSISEVLTALRQSELKEKIVPILPYLGGTKSLNALADLYNSSSGNLKKACFNGLTAWQDPAATAILFKICAAGTSEFYEDAFRGYVRQIRNSNLPDEQKLLKYEAIMALAKTDQQRLSVIRALSNVKTFLALVYVAKFLDSPSLQQTAANTCSEIALPESDQSVGLTGDIPRNILLKAIQKITGPESEYTTERIKRYLETMPAGPGFVPMFNGTDLTGWKGFVTDPVKKAALSEKDLAVLQAKADIKAGTNWTANNGMIVFTGEGDNLVSVKDYTNFELYVKWRILKKGDSGIYLRGSPQVQIWDTSRVEVGAQVGSGGLYNNQVNESKPPVVADNPIGEWNTFRIIMIGERVTVYLNGVLTVNNVILENYWDRKQPIFPSGSIELQAHGNETNFRDIYVREISDYEISPEEKASGFKPLFNGKNLAGWVGDTVHYSVVDGSIAIQPSRSEGGGNLYTEKEYGNFDFRFEFQLTTAANNGIGIRAPLEGDAAYVGMEIQVLDNTAGVYKDLHPYQYHGSVYGVVPAKREFLKPTGEWNSEEIIASGNQIKVILNGTAIVDADIAEASKNGTADGKAHPGLLRKEGHIGFLGHGSFVKFRNVRVKEL